MYSILCLSHRYWYSDDSSWGEEKFISAYFSWWDTEKRAEGGGKFKGKFHHCKKKIEAKYYSIINSNSRKRERAHEKLSDKNQLGADIWVDVAQGLKTFLWDKLWDLWKINNKNPSRFRGIFVDVGYEFWWD